MSSPRPLSALPSYFWRESLYQTPDNYRRVGDTSLINFSQQGQEQRPAAAVDSAVAPGFFVPGGIPSNVYPTKPTPLQLSDQGKKAIEFLQQKIGKKIDIYPLTAEDLQGAEGLKGKFNGLDAFGGSNNPTTRSLYLNPNGVGYHTLFHETGHANDPELVNRPTFDPAYITSLQRPADRLSYFNKTLFEPTVKQETTAQAFSGQQLPRFAAANPGLHIGYSSVFNDPWFKEYPASSSTKSIDEFYTAERPRMFAVDAGYDEPSAVATRLMIPEDSGRKFLSFGLDKQLRQKEQEIKDSARQYVDERLNRYQQQPTAWAQDYFAPR